MNRGEPLAATRRVSRRAGTLGAVALVLAVAAGCAAGPAGPGGSGEPACAAPELTAVPDTVAPGAEVVLTAEGFTECLDHTSVELGRESPDRPTPRPLRDLMVQWTQGATDRDLGLASPDQDGRLRLTLTIPADAAAGTARITVGDISAVTVTVR